MLLSCHFLNDLLKNTITDFLLKMLILQIYIINFKISNDNTEVNLSLTNLQYFIIAVNSLNRVYTDYNSPKGLHDLLVLNILNWLKMLIALLLCFLDSI